MTLLMSASTESTFRMSQVSPFISQFDSATLEQAQIALESGKLVVAPTETRYGLLCRADDESALQRLHLAKQRPDDMTSAVFLSSVTEIEQWAKVSAVAKKLQQRYLPGPLTLVLPANDKALKELSPKVIRGGEIGIRVSGSEFIAKLTASVSFPLTATSANISGADAPVTALEISQQLGNSVSLYVDGGELAGAVSTVVRCGAEQGSRICVDVLRDGAIPFEEIRVFVNKEFTGENIEVKKS